MIAIGIARFYYFRHLYPLEARVLLNNQNERHQTWATLSALPIIILKPFQLFLHSDQPLSEGEIILFSGTPPVGEAALLTPEAVVASRTD